MIPRGESLSIAPVGWVLGAQNHPGMLDSAAMIPRGMDAGRLRPQAGQLAFVPTLTLVLVSPANHPARERDVGLVAKPTSSVQARAHSTSRKAGASASPQDDNSGGTPADSPTNVNRTPRPSFSCDFA